MTYEEMVAKNKETAQKSFKYDFDKNLIVDYLKPADLYDPNEKGAKRIFYSIHFSEGKYGEHALLGVFKGGAAYFVDVPKHLTSFLKDVDGDDDAVKDINEGRAGFVVRPYKGKNGSTYYTLDFVSIER